METFMKHARRQYFEFPGIAWMLLIGLVFIPLLTVVFFPSHFGSIVPYTGPLGQLGTYLLQTGRGIYAVFILVGAITCHVCETAYCWRLCSQKNVDNVSRVKWILSTLCFGGFSLYELIQHKPVESEIQARIETTELKKD
ncbi:uncharacterized protein [Asterias amurensis]|uniref:uncharacterized protein n=1 Tax=Asterias amurensis TaxID=7602 RepID=UPI003AB523D8